jgi:hypothetical protein
MDPEVITRRTGADSHPTRTEFVALGELGTLDERTRTGNLLAVSRNRNCAENSAIPDLDHTQEVRGSSPLAPTILCSPALGMLANC